MLRLPLLLYILSAFSLSPAVFAWNTLTHANLAETAYHALPVAVQKPLAPYFSEIIQGAIDPDIFIQDWANHVLNVHDSLESQKAAPLRVKELYDAIDNKLAANNPALDEIAHEMGLISHYIADINQPLHTAEYFSESSIHTEYESDVLFWWSLYHFSDNGIRYRYDPMKMIRESAAKANRYYFGILDSYLKGHGIVDSQGMTRLNLNRAITDIRDTWLTLWLKNRAQQNQLSLWAKKNHFHLGETVNPLVSILPISQPSVIEADLYIALLNPAKEWSFLNENSEFSSKITPWRRQITIRGNSLKLFDNLLWPETLSGEYQLFARLVEVDGEVMQSLTTQSNTASIRVQISPVPEVSLHKLNDEVYLFPARWPGSEQIITLPIKRWDFLFTGNNESSTDRLIPGNFNHIMIYLGRDNQGTPYAMEMTQSFINTVTNLRLVRLPEFYTPDPDSESMSLSILDKDLWHYKFRWAKRLVKSELQKVLANEDSLLNQIESDWINQLPYQLEYDWSGDFSDKAVHLVDDGLDNGAGCTDYWLTILEQISEVCIKGSRMNAEEIVNYYLSDPEAAEVIIPESLNPFSFDISAPLLLNNLGFYVTDPLPHQFSCDGSTETGLPIPSRLINSPQLEAIKAELIINNWP